MRWRKMLGVAAVLYWVTAGSISAGYFGYRPTHVDGIQTWSGDKNEVLHFESGDPIFLRVFLGNKAKKRCEHFKNMLILMHEYGVGPKLLNSDATHIAMDFLEGYGVRVGELCNEAKLMRVMESMENCYAALRTIADSLPLLTLLGLAREELDNLPASSEREFFRSLLNQWDELFSEPLAQTGLDVVHGDLHTRNMRWSKGHLYVLDYESFGKGYILEDIARLSVSDGAKKWTEQRMLKYWYADRYNDEDFQLIFEACKIMARFAWNLILLESVPLRDIRKALAVTDPAPTTPYWMAYVGLTFMAPSRAEICEFLSKNVRDLQQLFQKARERGLGKALQGRTVCGKA